MDVGCRRKRYHSQFISESWEAQVSCKGFEEKYLIASRGNELNIANRMQLDLVAVALYIILKY